MRPQKDKGACQKLIRHARELPVRLAMQSWHGLTFGRPTRHHRARVPPCKHFTLDKASRHVRDVRPEHSPPGNQLQPMRCYIVRGRIDPPKRPRALAAKWR